MKEVRKDMSHEEGVMTKSVSHGRSLETSVTDLISMSRIGSQERRQFGSRVEES